MKYLLTKLNIHKKGIRMVSGWLLIAMGVLFAFLGIGGTAKLNMGKLGILSGSNGIVLIVVGVLFFFSGI